MRSVLFLLLMVAALVSRAEEYPPALGQMGGMILYETRQPLPPHMAFADKSGNTYRLQDFKGSVLVVNFWAAWCAPCRRELPSLAKLQAKYDPDDMRVVLMDVNRGDRRQGDEFLRKDGRLKDLLNLYEGGGDFSRAMELRALPITFIIDKQSRMVGYLPGEAVWHSRDTDFLVGHLLAE